MTDFEKTKQLLYAFGILYSATEKTEDDIQSSFISEKSITFGKDTHGEEYDGYPSCDKVDGYNGFYTRFEFDENGKFLSVGAWE